MAGSASPSAIDALPDHERAHRIRYAPSDEYDPAIVVIHSSPTLTLGMI
jgi:hypothetical protein